MPNGFFSSKPTTVPFNIGMWGKGLFVFLLCCTGPEIGRFLLEDLKVDRDYKKITEGKKVPSFLFSVNICSAHVPFITHNS